MLNMSDSDNSVELPASVSGIENDYNDDYIYGPSNGFSVVNDHQPSLLITEQPQPRGFRFRYGSEGSSHGGLQGVHSEKGRKTFPTVQICHHNGPARIVVTLVTDEAVPKVHAHELVGKNCQVGLCVVELKGGKNMTATFPNLGIRHATKKNVVKILQTRIEESLRLQNLFTTMSGPMQQEYVLIESDKEKARKQAEEQAKNMKLNAVRLCFQAYLMEKDGTFSRMLPSVISDTIYDSKATTGNSLKICRMDRQAGSCEGGEEVFLLCDKVQKDDIKVRFYQEDLNGTLMWEGYGDFGPQDVHRQYAIVFKTPAYSNTNIQREVIVNLELSRPSDNETSDWKPFTFYPKQIDKDCIDKKRKKALPFSLSNDTGGGGFPPGGSGGFGGGGGYGGFNGGMGGGGSENMGGYGGNQGNSFGGSSGYGGGNTGMSRPINGGPSDLLHPTPTEADDDLATDSAPFEATTDYHKQINMGLPFDAKPTKQMPFSSFNSKVYDVECPDPKYDSAYCSVYGDKTGAASSKASVHPSVPQVVPGNNDLALKIAERTACGLQDYAMTGNVAVILMVQRHLVAVQNESGDNTLHLAIIHHQMEALNNLAAVTATIPESGLVNQYNYLNQTPLHLAVITRQSKGVEILVKAGASASLVNRQGNTPIHLAAKVGDVECLRAVLPKNVEMFMDTIAPEINQLNYEGNAPVHLAALSGSVKCMRLLHAIGADMNQPDGRSGRTPLHLTVEREDLAMTGFLILEASVDVDFATFDGNTALHLACGRGLIGMTALLIAAGADPLLENQELKSEEDKSGHTAFDIAENNKKILKILNGEPYTSMSEIEEERKMKSMEDKEQIKSIESVTRSLRITDAGDLDRLDYSVRVSLGKLLDQPEPRKDWLALAELMGLGAITNILKGTTADQQAGPGDQQTGPTMALLDNYEAYDGTVAALRNMLLSLERQDAVDIIDKALTSYKTTEAGIKRSIRSIPHIAKEYSSGNCDSGNCESNFTTSVSNY